MPMSLEEQAHLAADLVRQNKWQELHTLLAQSPKSTDPDALRALHDQDAQGVEALLDKWVPEWQTLEWSAKVNAEARSGSNFGALVKK